MLEARIRDACTMWRAAYRSEKQTAAMNNAAARNDPKESILRFGTKNGSPKNRKWNHSAASIAGWSRPGRRWFFGEERWAIGIQGTNNVTQRA
jgi:hypothetical protein